MSLYTTLEGLQIRHNTGMHSITPRIISATATYVLQGAIRSLKGRLPGVTERGKVEQNNQIAAEPLQGFSDHFEVILW